jgi:hypothetical protein
MLQFTVSSKKTDDSSAFCPANQQQHHCCWSLSSSLFSLIAGLLVIADPVQRWLSYCPAVSLPGPAANAAAFIRLRVIRGAVIRYAIAHTHVLSLICGYVLQAISDIRCTLRAIKGYVMCQASYVLYAMCCVLCDHMLIYAVACNGGCTLVRCCCRV